jgi:hypothetical protein
MNGAGRRNSILRERDISPSRYGSAGNRWRANDLAAWRARFWRHAAVLPLCDAARETGRHRHFGGAGTSQEFAGEHGWRRALGRPEGHAAGIRLPLSLDEFAVGVQLDFEQSPGAGPLPARQIWKRQCWKEKLGPKRKPRIGLVWSGGFRPHQPHLWHVNRRRNIPWRNSRCCCGPTWSSIACKKASWLRRN